MDVLVQEIMSCDNVHVRENAVVYLRVVDAGSSTLKT